MQVSNGGGVMRVGQPGKACVGPGECEAKVFFCTVLYVLQSGAAGIADGDDCIWLITVHVLPNGCVQCCRCCGLHWLAWLDCGGGSSCLN
eukprot:5614727-Amphidinium_carterae.13